MDYVFIKKVGNGFDFAMSSNTYQAERVSYGLPFEFKLSNLQQISNNKITIIYQDLYELETSFLKILLEDELKDKDDLSIDYLKGRIIPMIKDKLKSIHRCFIKDEENEYSEHMEGDIRFITPNRIYSINSCFTIDVYETSFLEGVRSSLYAIDEIMGNPSVDKLLMSQSNFLKSHNTPLNHPFIFGNTSTRKARLLYLDGREEEINLEEFICQW